VRTISKVHFASHLFRYSC